MLARAGRDRIGLQMSVLGERFESKERNARAWLSNEPRQEASMGLSSPARSEEKRQLNLLHHHVLIPGARDGALLAELSGGGRAARPRAPPRGRRSG